MPSAFDTSTCRVALLSGGTSGEREISLASGKGALAALQEAGFTVQCFDPAKKEDLIALIDGNFDVAFLCLHGRKGEDGVIQGFLENESAFLISGRAYGRAQQLSTRLALRSSTVSREFLRLLR